MYNCSLLAPVAQRIEQDGSNVKVGGSNPSWGAMYGPLAQLVEQVPLKHSVTGSSPVRLTILD